MKKTEIIYHYEGFYKFYLRTEERSKIKGVGLPANSTDLQPPLEQCKEGQIPVFEAGAWVIRSDDFWRPETIEKNYDAQRSSSTFKPLALSSIHGFPDYPNMPMLCNSHLVKMAIVQKNRMLHRKFYEIVSLHKKIFDNSPKTPLDSPNFKELATSPTELYCYKLEVEAFTYLIRKILDSTVQLTFLLTNFDDFIATKKITYNEIGKFTGKESPSNDIETIIMGDGNEFEKDHTNFLLIINELFNSFKHSLIHDESYSLFCLDYPTVTSYQAKNNDHSKQIIYHNHNAYHLIMGYQDNLKRILKNQLKYLELKSNA